VIVTPTTKETNCAVCGEIGISKAINMPCKFNFSKGLGNVKRPFQPDRFRDVAEKLINARSSNAFEHIIFIIRGVQKIRHDPTPSNCAV
jgi:hypothetical protein